MKNTILSSNIPEINELKRTILIDRDFDVDDSFYDYIDDNFIFWLLETVPESDKLFGFVKGYGDRFRSYKDVIIRVQDADFKYVFLFDQKKIARACRSLKGILEKSKFYEIIISYAKHEDIDISMIYTALHIQKMFWFLKSYSETIFLMDKVSAACVEMCDEETTAIVFPRIYKACIDVATILYGECNISYTSMEYYKLFPNSGIIESEFISVYYNICHYFMYTEKCSEIPDSVGAQLALLTDNVEITTVADFIIDSLDKNANNVKILKYLSHQLIQDYRVYDIVNGVLYSKIPIKDFSYVSSLDDGEHYKGIVHYFNKDYTITQLLKQDIDILSIYNNIPFFSIDQYMVTISTYCSYANIERLLLENPYVSNNGSYMRIVEYIMECIIPKMTSSSIEKLAPVILGNDEIVKYVSMNTIAKLITVNIIEFVVKYPKTLQVPYILKSLSIPELTNVILQNMEALQYIDDGMLLTINMIKHTVSIKGGYVKLNPSVILDATAVTGIIDSTQRGYGYILDLPTEAQQNIVIKYLYDNYYNEKFV